MNTKSAVILMIGLLGIPAVFNFTKQMDSPGPRWSVVPVARKERHGPQATWGILLDNRTGEVRYLLSGLAGIGPEGRFFNSTKVFMSPPATPNPSNGTVTSDTSL
jgi:hypothetical protein